MQVGAAAAEASFLIEVHIYASELMLLLII